MRGASDLTKSGRFSRSYRDAFATKICSHFDKYAQIKNPLTFDPINDVYKHHFSSDDWKAIQQLLLTKAGHDCLNTSSRFDLYLPAEDGRTQTWQRNRIGFRFNDDIWRPSPDIEFDSLPENVQDNIRSWVVKAIGLKQLRGDLWRRCNALVNDGWEPRRSWNPQGHWVGGPEAGVGCNTPNQVVRIWPELQPFMGDECKDSIRNANVKSRLPGAIKGFGTIAQFKCEAQLFHDRDEDDPYSEEEMKLAKRKFDAMTEILVQASLLVDVNHVKGYPDVQVNS